MGGRLKNVEPENSGLEFGGGRYLGQWRVEKESGDSATVESSFEFPNAQRECLTVFAPESDWSKEPWNFPKAYLFLLLEDETKQLNDRWLPDDLPIAVWVNGAPKVVHTFKTGRRQATGRTRCYFAALSEETKPGSGNKVEVTLPVRRGVTFSGAYLDLPDQVPYGDLNAAVSSSMGQPAIAKKKTALDRPFTRRNGQNMLGTTALRYAILAGSSQSDSRHLVWLGPSEAPCCRVRSRVSTARARLASAGSRSGYPAMAREKIGSWRTHSPIASTTKREPHPDRCRGSGHPSDPAAKNRTRGRPSWGGREGGSGSREAYSLTVRANQVELEARSTAGPFYGAETACQVLEGSGEKAELPIVEIHGWPALAYRGDGRHEPRPTAKARGGETAARIPGSLEAESVVLLQ